MKKNTLVMRGISLLTGFVLILSVTSCGTILYPERRGQRAGHIDTEVAVLDGIGLLFFFLPGVIAFAVDFSTGAIYLPDGSYGMSLTPSTMQDARIIQAGSHPLTRHNIETMVEKETGRKIDLSSPLAQAARISSDQDLTWDGIAEVLTPDQLAVFENDPEQATLAGRFSHSGRTL